MHISNKKMYEHTKLKLRIFIYKKGKVLPLKKRDKVLERFTLYAN